MQTMLLHYLVKFFTRNFIVEWFQAPAGEVAEDDGEHGKSVFFLSFGNEFDFH